MDQHIISIYCRFFDRTHDKLYFWHSFPSIVIFQFQNDSFISLYIFPSTCMFENHTKISNFYKNDRKMTDRYQRWISVWIQNVRPTKHTFQVKWLFLMIGHFFLNLSFSYREISRGNILSFLSPKCQTHLNIYLRSKG